MIDDPIINYFSEKDDQKMTKIKSKCHFFEIFDIQGNYLEIPIAETITFQDGNPKCWLLNSGKNNKIIKRKAERLNAREILKNFDCDFPRLHRQINNDDLSLVELVLEELKVFLYITKRDYSILIKMNSSETISIKPVELIRFINEKAGSLNIIQKKIDNATSEKQTKTSNSTYYACMRMSEDSNFAPKFKCISKYSKVKPNKNDWYLSINPSNNPENISESMQDISSKKNVIDFIKSLDFYNNIKLPEQIKKSIKKEYLRNYSNKYTCRLIHKVIDSFVLENMQEYTKSIIVFIEKCYGIRILKIICKFVISTKNEIFFIGIKLMLASGEQFDNKKEIYFQEIGENIKKIPRKKFKLRTKSLAFLKNKEINQLYSNKLMNSMNNEKCFGDFCNCIYLEVRRGLIHVKDNNYFNKDQIPLSNRIPGSSYDSKLTYSIPMKNILNTRENWEPKVQILINNMIVPDNLAAKIVKANSLKNITSSDFIKSNETTSIRNNHEKYKLVKLCSKCYEIYSFLIKSEEVCIRKEISMKEKYKHSQLKISEMMKEMNPKELNSLKLEKISKNPINSNTQGTSFYENMASFKGKELSDRDRTLKSTRLKLGLLIHNKAAKPKKIPKIKPKQSMTMDESTLIMMNGEPSKKMEKIPLLGMTKVEFTHMKEEASKKNPISVIRAKVLRKKEEEVTKNEFQIVERKHQNIKRVLNSINRGLERSSSLTDFKNLLNKKKDLLKESTNDVPSSLYHMNILHLRNLHDYRIHVPRKCYHFREKDCIFHLKDISFPKLFNMLKSQLPYSSMKEVENIFQYKLLSNEIKVFTIDEHTCMPYLILKSHDYNKEFGEVIFVFNDIFDNFLLQIIEYQRILASCSNKKIILFNYPGQLFTIFDKDQILPNDKLAEIFDAFIFYLQELEKIDLETESIKLMGIGYGGNIMAIFASLFLGSFPKLSSLLFVNSFLYIENSIYSSLLDCKKSFQEVPSDLSELTHEFWASLTMTEMPSQEKIKQMEMKNPLSIDSRIYMIDCCLNGNNLLDIIQCIDIPIYAVHTLQNSFVNIQHADILTEYRPDKRIDNIADIFLPKLVLKKEKLPPVRERAYLEGGHDIQSVLSSVIKENPEAFFEIVSQFIHQS